MTWISSIQTTNYIGLSHIDLVALCWGMITVHEAVERKATLWNTIDYKTREGFLKGLYQLIYFCTS